jgi:hypothetical protein
LRGRWNKRWEIIPVANNHIVPALIVVICCLTNCVTGTKNASYTNYPDEAIHSRFQLNSVNVSVDHVNDNKIAEQMRIIAETYLDAKQNNDTGEDKILLVDITLTQRSFMYNVDLYNTIYAAVDVHDETGIVFARENIYISGKKTIVSAVEQNAILQNVLKRLIKNREKINRRLLKQKNNMDKEEDAGI